MPGTLEPHKPYEEMGRTNGDEAYECYMLNTVIGTMKHSPSCPHAWHMDILPLYLQ